MQEARRANILWKRGRVNIRLFLAHNTTCRLLPALRLRLCLLPVLLHLPQPGCTLSFPVFLTGTPAPKDNQLALYSRSASGSRRNLQVRFETAFNTEEVDRVPETPTAHNPVSLLGTLTEGGAMSGKLWALFEQLSCNLFITVCTVCTASVWSACYVCYVCYVCVTRPAGLLHMPISLSVFEDLLQSTLTPV